MRIRRLALAAPLFLASFLVNPSALLAQSQTTTGTITDAMCGAHHMMSNTSAADCTRACVKQGSEYALMVGDKLYTLKGNAADLSKFAGSKVTVTGKTAGSTITVESVKAAS